MCWLAMPLGAGDITDNLAPQGAGFPSTSGQNSGTFGATLMSFLRGWGKLLETLTFSGFQSRSIRNYLTITITIT